MGDEFDDTAELLGSVAGIRQALDLLFQRRRDRLKMMVRLRLNRRLRGGSAIRTSCRASRGG